MSRLPGYALAAGLGGVIARGDGVAAGGIRDYLIFGPIHYDFMLPIEAGARAVSAALRTVRSDDRNILRRSFPRQRFRAK